MKKNNLKKNKKNSPLQKTIRFVFFGSLAIAIVSALIYINYNFSKIIRDRINDIYSQTLVSKYYNLDFKKVRVNLITGNLGISNVRFYPIIDSNQQFFNKNGSVDFKMGEINFNEVNLLEFVSVNNITVSKVRFKDVDVIINKNKEIFQPFAFIKKSNNVDNLDLKIRIDDFNISNASFALNDITNSEDVNSFEGLDVYIQNIVFRKNSSDFVLGIDSINTALEQIQHNSKRSMDINIDAVNFIASNIQIIKDSNDFDFTYSKGIVEIHNPNLVTQDKIYNIGAESIIYHTNTSNLLLLNAKVKSLLSRKEFNRKNKYQEQLIDILIENIYVNNIDIDRLKNGEGIIAQKVVIDNGIVQLYKDKRKPLNTKKYPEYLAQEIFAIKKPLQIKEIIGKGIDVLVRLKQQDGRMSSIDITDIELSAYNIQNKDLNQRLKLFAKGKIQNTLAFSVNVDFKYKYNYFTYSGKIKKAKIADITETISSFVPVNIQGGIIDNASFSGYASRTFSKGEMLFLYHNLIIEVDRQKEDKNTNFSNHLLSFAANSVLNLNNPNAPNLPPRNVDYFAERDMNKGFINLLIKSVLAGLKESVLPSNENRKKYRKIRKKNSK